MQAVSALIHQNLWQCIVQGTVFMYNYSPYQGSMAYTSLTSQES